MEGIRGTWSVLTQLRHSTSSVFEDGRRLRATDLTKGGGRRRPRGRGRRGRNGHPDPQLARLSVGWRLPTSPSPLGRHDTRQRLLMTQQGRVFDQNPDLFSEILPLSDTLSLSTGADVTESLSLSGICIHEKKGLMLHNGLGGFRKVKKIK